MNRTEAGGEGAKLERMSSSVDTATDPQTNLDRVANYRERLAAVKQQLREHSHSAYLTGYGTGLNFLTGITMDSHERLTVLVVPADEADPAALITPKLELTSALVERLEALGITLLAWTDADDPYTFLAQAGLASGGSAVVDGALASEHTLRIMDRYQLDLVPASDVVAEVFFSKQDFEVAELTRAGAAIDRVHAAVPALLQDGRSEREVADELAELILQEHEVIDFIIVGSGPNGALPHHSFSDRIMRTGEMVVVDLGGTLDSGYHSDCTRTYIVGAEGDPARAAELADPEALAMYQVLEEAQAAARAAVRPGVIAREVDAAARNVIEAAGMGEYFIHRTGHGIGLEGHEPPFISQQSTVVLTPGMCFSIEPGIYFPEKFGARLEDIVTVTEDGYQSLNLAPRELR